MIDQFINFVIRPPRADYNPDQYLWEKNFTLAGRAYQRQDLELRNSRGHTLQCSHYLPSPIPEDTPLPCVVYCHGNSGCRADANEAAVILLPSNITVFTLDFSGSGLSDGDYVSLGWHERDDLKVVVTYLRSDKQVSRIGLWGRSMGAVTRGWTDAIMLHHVFVLLSCHVLVAQTCSLLYGAEDPSVAGMVLDSAFSNLYNLMMELVDVYKIRLPKFTVKMAVQYMRRVIEKKAKFDIMNLNCLQVTPKTFIPALFGHANCDKFVQPHHSEFIYNSYAGDKNIIKFDGDHNSSRPQFYYDSVSIFFYNVLHPPQLPSAHASKLEKYYDLGDLKIGADMDENLIYEIISSLRSTGNDAAGSSSAPSVPTTKFIGDLISEIPPVITEIDTMPNDYSTINSDEPSHLQEQPNDETEECCSYTSSNRESWGRCSSLGGSDEESSAGVVSKNEFQETLEAFPTPLRSTQGKPSDSSKDDKKKKKKVATSPKQKKSKTEKLEALSRHLRLCILRRVHR